MPHDLDRSGTTDSPSHDGALAEIEMFLVDADGEFVTHGAIWAEASEETETIVAAGDIDQTILRLHPGARVGRVIDEPHRAGFPEEILVTLHADPVRAARTAVGAGFLAQPISGLRIDPASRVDRRNELRWDARLRTAPWARRPAHVRLYGSPSSNVTVLTLSPTRPRRIATRWFLRSGMRAMTALRDRLERDLRSESSEDTADDSSAAISGGRAQRGPSGAPARTRRGRSTPHRDRS